MRDVKAELNWLSKNKVNAFEYKGHRVEIGPWPHFKISIDGESIEQSPNLTFLEANRKAKELIDATVTEKTTTEQPKPKPQTQKSTITE